MANSSSIGINTWAVLIHFIKNLYNRGKGHEGVVLVTKCIQKYIKNSIYNPALRKASLNLVILNNIRRNKFEFLTILPEAFTINLSKSDEDISKKEARLFLETAYAKSSVTLSQISCAMWEPFLFKFCRNKSAPFDPKVSELDPEDRASPSGEAVPEAAGSFDPKMSELDPGDRASSSREAVPEAAGSETEELLVAGTSTGGLSTGGARECETSSGVDCLRRESLEIRARISGETNDWPQGSSEVCLCGLWDDPEDNDDLSIDEGRDCVT
ncbi:hypothetical protein P5673_016430 [Acropora cervicornis]|uniref:Uncharacterized protein n=1 Tax=Acropora cervicornis TaxID=6130 RepID=A0AAD9QG46_ACRCE|nr:hypothetical protein P5673_016430 [Acropora cervicornis]